MSTDALIVFVVLALTVTLFVSDRIRLDLAALIGLLALVLTGVLTPPQALSGFADGVVIMIAALFVVSGALFRTGVAARIGYGLGRVAGTGRRRLLVVLMLSTGVLSGFMSSTGTVAMMLPVAVALAWRAGMSPSLLLIPLAFASLLGGMLTLIGTAPNVVVSQLLQSQGMPGFGFFAFTPFGVVMLVIGVAFMVTVGRHWLPPRAPASERPEGRGGSSLIDLIDRYGLPARVFRTLVPAEASCVGATLTELRWPERHQVQVLSIEAGGGGLGPRRAPARTEPIGPNTRVEAGDLLLLQGSAAAVEALADEQGLEVLHVDAHAAELMPPDLGAAELLPTPRSRWLDSSLADLRFRDRYGLQVLAVLRGGATITEGLPRLKVRFGDTLLVQGPRKAIEVLRAERYDAVVIDEAGADVEAAPAADRAGLAVLVLVGMLLAMTFGWLPTEMAALVAAVAMVVSGCLSMDDAYRSINWEAVVLIAAVLPMATALEVSGGMQLVVDALVHAVEPYGPYALLIGLFVLTSVASQVISNTATTVLLAPIALASSLALDVSPYPLLMTVALAASTAFATPVASPVNTLVLGPGQYRFGDFLRVGVALQALVLVATVVLVPLVFPF